MVKTILFPLDTEEVIKKKVSVIEQIVGEHNVCEYGLFDTTVPSIDIRCNKKQWKEIKFKCELVKTYW